MAQPTPNPAVTIDVLLEDPRFVIVAKPPGIVTDPGLGHLRDSLMNGAFARWGPALAKLGESRDHGLLHRLDRDSSGAIVIAMPPPLMDGVVARALAEPVKLAGFIAGAFGGMLLCNLVMALGTLPFLDRRTALTAGYCSNGRHNALLMAVLPVTADPDIFLFIAAVQFPIYLMPTLLQPLYRRLLRSA